MVWPLDDEMRAYLDDMGVDVPDVPSRWPTAREVFNVVETLEGYEAKLGSPRIGQCWQAFIQSKTEPEVEWTLVNMDYEGDDSDGKLWFEKVSEALNKQILARLAKTSGPLVLLADVGGDPEIIGGADDEP